MRLVSVFSIVARRVIVSILAGFIFAMGMSQGVYAQSDPISGTWSLNAAKSTFPPGQAPRSQILTYQGTGASKTATAETVDAQGKQARSVFIHIYDGQAHPTTGSPDTDASAYTHIDASTIIFTRMKAGKLAGIGSIVASPDGRTLTVSGTGASGVGGNQANYVVVYEKR